MHGVLSFLKVKDIRFLSLFNQTIQCSFLDIFMNIITHLGSLPVAVALLLALLFSSEAYLVTAGQELTGVMLVSQALVHLLKWLFDRPRPYRVDKDVIVIYPPTSQRSFPSGHSCAAFAIAVTLGSIFPTWLPLLLGLALLVGISRVYLGAHYPSDVLVGFMLAVATWALF